MISPTTSLHTALRLAFTGPLNWLSGEPPVDAAMRWVATSLEEAASGDVLVLAAGRAGSQTLARARELAVTLVLLVGDLPAELPALPEGLPVAQVTSPDEVRSVQQLLLTIFINQRAALMERGVRIHSQLSQLAAEGEGLDGLVRAMADISGRGVLVQDKRLGILAQSPSSTLASIWEDIVMQIRSPAFLPEALRDRKQAGRQSILLVQDIPGGLARLVVPITVGEVVRGYLSLVGLVDELDALDHLVAEQGAFVCAVEMARAKAVRETEKRLKGDLLTALLQENLSPRDTRLWVQAMGLDLSQAHVALRFAWDSPSAPSRRRLETLVNGEIARRGLKVILSPMGAEVICFCQEASGTPRPQLALELGQAVVDQGFVEYPDHPVRCGVGKPAGDLSDWRSSFRQAGQALEMARRFGERKPLFFPDLSVYRLLLQIEHNPELVAFQEEMLGALLSHENADELLHTLEAYFEHNGNLSQAAEALFVHRNTLVYRMERIAAITHLNLDQPETRLAVQLALHIHRMMGARRA